MKVSKDEIEMRKRVDKLTLLLMETFVGHLRTNYPDEDVTHLSLYAAASFHANVVMHAALAGHEEDLAASQCEVFQYMVSEFKDATPQKITIGTS